MTFKEVYDKYSEEEYLEFNRIPNAYRLSNRPDLHAFMLLDRLIPGQSDIVSAAEHDEFFLDIDQFDLESVATEDQMLQLIRCGVRPSEHGCLAMFA